jgi:hypothetical protein
MKDWIQQALEDEMAFLENASEEEIDEALRQAGHESYLEGEYDTTYEVYLGEEYDTAFEANYQTLASLKALHYESRTVRQESRPVCSAYNDRGVRDYASVQYERLNALIRTSDQSAAANDYSYVMSA